MRLVAPLTVLLRYKPLDTGLEKRFLENEYLKRKLKLIDVSESWSESADPLMWEKYVRPRTVGIVWGMHKLESPVFINFCKKRNIPLLYMERSPLLKNGQLSIYFDRGGTTNFSAYWREDSWRRLVEKGLTSAQLSELEKYRMAIRGCTKGIDVQKSEFESMDQIKARLGIPSGDRVLFCPLQVDHDVTITERASSPWIRNMEHFMWELHEAYGCLPSHWHVVVKDHPRNIWEGRATNMVVRESRIHMIRDEINANALVQGCDAVLTINSGMGTEAMLFHKPVISLGKSFYSDKGLNFEAGNSDALKELIGNIDTLAPPKDKLDIYIYHFLTDFTYDLTNDRENRRFLSDIFNMDRGIGKWAIPSHDNNSPRSDS